MQTSLLLHYSNAVVWLPGVYNYTSVEGWPTNWKRGSGGGEGRERGSFREVISLKILWRGNEVLMIPFRRKMLPPTKICWGGVWAPMLPWPSEGRGRHTATKYTFWPWNNMLRSRQHTVPYFLWMATVQIKLICCTFIIITLY